MRVQDLAPIAISFVVVAIVLGVGADVLDDIQVQSDDDTTSVTLTNSTTNGRVTDNSTTVSNVYPLGITSFGRIRSCALTVTYATNSTGGSGTLIPSSNYTITGCNVQYNGPGDTGWNNSLWNITGTYKYSTDDAAYNASEYGLDSLQTLAEWLPTIALVMAAAIVIGVIVTYFMFRTGVT